MPKIEHDFFEDLRREAVRDMLDAGLSVPNRLKKPSERGFIEAGQLWWTARLRAIPPRRYLVAVSRELEAKEADLAPADKRGLLEIKRRAMAGENLNPFQSSSYENPRFNDGLFSEWGVHHLHLGKPRSRGTVKRSDSVLFLRKTESTLFLVDIRDHEKSFESIDLLQIAFDNWPWQFEPIAAKTADTGFTAEELEQARRFGINSLITLRDGQVLFAPGGGLLGRGASFRAGMLADEWCTLAAHLTKAVPAKAAEIAARIESETGSCPDPIRLQLRLSKGGWELVETTLALVLCTHRELFPNLPQPTENG